MVGDPKTATKLAEANVATANLDWYNFFITNLIPVTLGNIVGAAVFVAAFYWYVYLRGPLCVTNNELSVNLCLRVGQKVQCST